MILEQVTRTLFSRFRVRREPVSLQKPLCFMHIPKTAGTSLNYLLASRFPAGACLYRAHGLANRKCDVNQFQFISGHVGFEFLERFHAKPTVVTFLRHPIDHALSTYFFFGKSFRPEQIRDISSRIGEDLSSASVASWVWFCEQAHRLSLQEMLLKEPDLAKSLFPNRQTLILAGVPGGVACDLVSRASENLAQCEIVGLTERLEESVGLLCGELGWEPFTEIPRHNKTRHRMQVSELDDETREALAQILAPDIALYESAQKLFEQRLQAAAHRDQSSLERPREAALPDAANFSFDQPFIGAGWHHREKSRTKWSCWSGPGTESWLEFRPPVATNCHFRCELLHDISPQVLQSVQVRINDQLLTLYQRGKKGRVVLEGSVPAQAISSKRDRLRISFIVNHRWRPCDLNPTSNDDRWLGINVRRINLTARA